MPPGPDPRTGPPSHPGGAGGRAPQAARPAAQPVQQPQAAQPAQPPAAPPATPATHATRPASHAAQPPTQPPAQPPAPPPAGPPSRPVTHDLWPTQTFEEGAHAAAPPSSAAPFPASHPASFQTAQPRPEDQAAAEPPVEQPQRLNTATDFLERRAEAAVPGPATWGWRGRVRRWTGGLIKPRMGTQELAYEQDRAAVQRDFAGPRTIAFINPKGGAAKTTGVLAAGYTFGTVRGGGVVAWDNNETRGTLGIRGHRSRASHSNTTRELLEDMERFADVFSARIGDLGSFVRSQGDAHFDVLASDERADVTGTIRGRDFTAVHQLLQRFYRVVLVDTGNNMRAENWLAAAETADLLVVTSTVREDTGYSGLWMLDALDDAGYVDLKAKTITVLSDPSPKVDASLARDLTNVYTERTGGVFRVPYDPAFVDGSVVDYGRLSPDTQRSWLRACAAMAGAL